MNFIRKHVSLGWLIVFVGSGIYFWNILNLGFWGILVFPVYVIWGIISVKIAEHTRPDAIITSGGYLSHVNAQLFYDIGLPLAIMFVLPVLLLLMIGNFLAQPNLDKLRTNVQNSCAVEQIAKTGTAGCKEAKSNLTKFINDELPKIKLQYKTAQNDLKTFTKSKETKCSEKGLEEFGSEGCKLATQGFDKNTKLVESLKGRIEGLEKELNELKSK